MRRTIVLLALAALAAACSSFGGDDPGSSSSSSGGDGSDAGSDGPNVVNGNPADFALSIAPVNGAQTIIQGKNTTIPIVLTRGKQLTGSATITIAGFTNGMAAAPLTIDGTTGNLILSSPTGAQGDAQGLIVATIGTQKATTPLAALVRGAPGTLDTTWGTNGQVLTSDPGAGFTTRFLLLGTSDDVFSLASKTNDTVNGSIAHVDAAGKLDPTWGSAGIRALEPLIVNDASLTPAGQIAVFGGTKYIPGTGIISMSQFSATNGGLTYAVTSVTTPFTYGAGAFAVAIRGDNHVFFAWDNDNGGEIDCGTAHLDELGFPVAQYGNSGFERFTVSVPVGAFFQSSAVTEPLNVISVGGGFVYYQRLASDTGAVATGFETGKPISVPGAVRPDAGPSGIVMLADKSVVAPFYSTGGIRLVKFDKDGAPAAGFGTAGIAGPYPIPDTGAPTGIALDGNGKFVVAFDRGGLVRFGTDGSIDTDFGASGKATTPGLGGDQLHRKVVVQKSGRILASGPGSSDAEVVVSAYWP